MQSGEIPSFVSASVSAHSMSHSMDSSATGESQRGEMVELQPSNGDVKLANNAANPLPLLPDMVSGLNQSELAQYRLHFSVAEVSGKTVIEVMDQETGDIIRQIPSEEAVAFAEHWAKTQQLLSPFSV